MYYSGFVILSILAASSHAAPYLASHVVHEKRDSSPSQWMRRDRIPSNAILPMRVGLKQNNLDKGYELLMDV